MRGKIIWAALAVVLALAAWALMTPSGETGRVGVNQRVENQVTTAAAGQADWRPSVVGADVSFGDRIATAAASRLEISLLDRSTLTVGANARIDVDRFVYDPERGVAGVAVSVLRGVFRFASDNRGAQPEPIAFRTPGSAIGIRGTLIEGVVGPEAVAFLTGVPGAPDLSAEADSAAVIILRQGAIGVAVNGQSVILDRPVQMVVLTRTRLYSPFEVSGETTRRFEALLPTRPGAVGPPPAAPPAISPSGDTPIVAVPSPATGPADKPEGPPPPTVRPPVREPRAPDPAVRPPLTRAPPTAGATAPAASAPAVAAPDSPTLRQPLATTAPPTRAVPVDTPLRQPVQPPPGQQ